MYQVLLYRGGQSKALVVAELMVRVRVNKNTYEGWMNAEVRNKGEKGDIP